MSTDHSADDTRHHDETTCATHPPIWAPLAIGALAAVAVWSPLTGSALGMSMLAGLCAVVLCALPRVGLDVDVTRASAGVRLLATTVAILVALSAISILGAVTDQPWISWVAAIAALPLVSGGVWLTARRSRRAPQRERNAARY